MAVLRLRTGAVYYVPKSVLDPVETKQGNIFFGIGLPCLALI